MATRPLVQDTEPLEQNIPLLVDAITVLPVGEHKEIKLCIKRLNIIKLITKNNLVLPFKRLFKIKNIRLTKIV